MPCSQFALAGSAFIDHLRQTLFLAHDLKHRQVMRRLQTQVRLAKSPSSQQQLTSKTLCTLAQEQSTKVTAPARLPSLLVPNLHPGQQNLPGQRARHPRKPGVKRPVGSPLTSKCRSSLSGSRSVRLDMTDQRSFPSQLMPPAVCWTSTLTAQYDSFMPQYPVLVFSQRERWAH